MFIQKNIRWLQSKKKATSLEMAHLLNTNYRTYQSWCDKRKIRPSLDMLIKLSEIAGVSLTDFIKTDLSTKPQKKINKKDLVYQNYINADSKIKKAVETLLELK